MPKVHPLFFGGIKLEQELKKVYEAQKLDTQIFEKEKRLISAPKMIAAMEQEIETLKNNISKEKEVIDELEKERRKKEKELETDKDKIKKYESKLYEVKTNKEYQALLKEIETVKSTNDNIEEDILILMEKIEELKSDFTNLSAQLKKKEKEFDQNRDKLLKEVDTIGKDVKKLKEERDNLLSDVNSNLRTTYTTLIEKRGGTAVVNLKNGVCLGCFMNIPPQLFIEATKNIQLILCPSCNRIFFFQEDPE